MPGATPSTLNPKADTAELKMNDAKSSDYNIREVWASNLEAEMHNVRSLVRDHHYIAMDTEFPGVVARPNGEFRNNSDYQYQLLRLNVDLLTIIQLGLTFYDDNGRLANACATFQFNFKFSLKDDMYAGDSIALLQNSGLQFNKHEEDGIDPTEFAVLLMTSGVVLFDNIVWISFHAGYDFAYLLKILTGQPLPTEETEFFQILKTYFPNIYDVKYLMRSCKKLKGGLQEVSEQLKLERIGSQHQAGSDSLLTGATFFKMRKLYFDDHMDSDKYCGHIYGLGFSLPSFNAPRSNTNSERGSGGSGFPTTGVGTSAPAGAASNSLPSSSSAIFLSSTASNNATHVRPASVGP